MEDNIKADGDVAPPEHAQTATGGGDATPPINFWQRMRRRMLSWQLRNFSTGTILMLLCTVTGILTGLAATFMRQIVARLNHYCLLGLNLDGINWRYLWLPLVGVAVTAFYQRKVMHASVSRCTAVIKHHLVNGQYRLTPFDVFNPLIGCAMTVGLGASAGTEGPVALSGAAIGSSLGQYCRLPQEWIRMLIAVGAGAGIAGIFKAPIGGLMFSLEVLQVELSTLSVIGLAVACVISSTTVVILSGETYDMSLFRSLDSHMEVMGWVALLGIFCGLYSIYYCYSKKHAYNFFANMNHRWLATIATGLLLSISVFMFPTLYSEGFNVIGELLNSNTHRFLAGGLFYHFASHKVWIFIAIIAILLLKGILVAASYSGGGVAGDFVPTLFAGCMAGYLFSFGLNTLFHLDLPMWFFALMGMGAVMAGTIHAPVMALFVVCEITNTYAFIVPYVVVIALSYATVKTFAPKLTYSATGHDDILALSMLKARSKNEASKQQDQSAQ